MFKRVASSISGTMDNDVLLGTSGDDVIDALAGNDDIVSAFGGNDTINAGSGDDAASAGEGDDRVLGGAGTDFIRGGAGNDRLDGGTETDTVLGDDGDDTIRGGDGNDLIFGDRIDFGGTGNDLLKGGAGDDKILGAEGDDLILGGDDKDILNGSLGNDSVYGNADNDQVFGFTGDDQVYGNRGDDVVNGGEGNDLVFGGRGNDTLFGLTVSSFQTNLGKGEIDTLMGNAGNDIFVFGDILPNGTQSVFYDDADASTVGTDDYALIADFGTHGSPVGKGKDIIQLSGSAADYTLGTAPTGLPSGTGIFYNNSDPELIALVAGVSPSNLNLANANQFTFLEQPPTNPEPGEPSQQPRIEVLASGLDSPRKLSFGPDGALYVAEAGRGGTGASIPSPSQPGAVLSYGATGAIIRIQNGAAERVVTGLPSLALADGSDAAGVNDIEFDADGNAYAIVGLASNPANRDSLLQVPDFSQLLALDNFGGGASWTRLSDFGAYEQNNNPDGQDINTNLYDLLIEDNTAYVIDAGANSLLSQRAFSGEPSLEAVFPARTTTDPLTGEAVVRQSVPTSVTVGPDGALYVGELTGFPFQAETAQVYRISVEGQPEVYAGGFTNIVDLAFDHSGGLYVLEYDADGILNGSDAGALIYVSPDGKTRTTIADDQLINPTGLEIGADGDIYISNKGFVAGQGEVLRLSLEKEAGFSPEPLYDQVKHYTTMIEVDGDPADVYYPVVPNSTADQLPIVLLLQGALVDKADYSNYAEEVASYGFVVVVPNNERTLTAPDGQTVTGLFSEQGQVNDVLDQMKVEDADPTSPIFEIADTETLGLLGHSFGGAVGLGATQEEICISGICSEGYTPPLELQAGIFYGTNFRDQQTGEFLPINNEDIPIGLIAGTLDSITNFGEVASTYVEIQDTPKALIAIEGANHYGITNTDNLTREQNRPTLDQATATAAIGRWSGLFLRSHLLNDQGAFDYVYNTGGDLDPNVNTISQTL